MIQCANCNRALGNLEPTGTWNGRLVCSPCYTTLYNATVGQAAQPQNIYYIQRDDGNRGLAALLSFLIPGVGQMYLGHVGAGVGWLLGTFFGYCFFILPGAVIHIVCVICAATAPRRN